MPNLLNFPSTCIVDKTVPKNAFWQKASNPASLKDLLTQEFQSITWLYKLTAQTLNVKDGNFVHEIDVFHCLMKSDHYSINSFCAMDRLLPRHTLFIIEYGQSYDIIMHHKERTVLHGETVWRCGETEMLRHIETNNPTTNNSTTLTIEGQTMDTVYLNLLAQVSSLSVSSQAEYEDKAGLRQQLQNIEKQIASLQKRIRTERQFNRQVEMNSEARQLKRQAEEIKKQLRD